MAESESGQSTPQTQAGEAKSRELTLRIDESEMKQLYANTIRSYSTIDEVILDFGVNLPSSTKQDELVFKVKDQVIINWRTAKRLALSLASMVRQHEERYGEIDPKPTTKGAPSAKE